MEEFTINCTGDVVTGDVIRFEESVFGGSHRKPKYLGTRIVEAEVLNDSYGERKQQHTFSLLVLASTGTQALSPGARTTRKGRNVYRNGTMRKPWTDESARGAARQEKHARGDRARAARDERRELQLGGLYDGR